MILSRLKVHNLRSYTSAHLELGPGITLLTGDVGSGKTSLLYAIEMALFGFAEVEPAYLVRHRAREAEVTLTLASEGHTHELRRRFRRRTLRGRESFEIEENSFATDGQRTRYSATELKQRAIDLLGFPDNPNPRAHSDVWRWAVYIPQERMREVLLQSPSERLETARKALGLEQYRTAAENAAEVATELRHIAQLDEVRAEALAHWTEELPRWSAIRITRSRELEELESEALTRRREEEAARGELARWEAARVERERDRRELERLRKAEEDQRRDRAERVDRRAGHERLLGELRARTERTRTQRTALEPALAPGAGLEERLRELELALRETERTVADRARAEATRAALDRSLAEQERSRQLLERERTELARRSEAAGAERPLREPPAPTPRDLPTIQHDLDAHRAENDSAIGGLARARQVATETEELLRLGTCPRCQQPVRPEEYVRHLEEARGALRTAEERSRALHEEIRRLDEERASRERYERARERFELVQAGRRQLEEQLRAVDARRTEMERRHVEMLEERGRAEAEWVRLAPAAEARTRLEEDRERIAEERTRRDHARAEATRLEEELRGAEARRELLEGERARLAREIAELDERIRATGEEAGRLERPEEETERTERALTEARSLSERTRAELERTMGRLATTRAAVEEADRRITEADRGVRDRAERIAEADHARALAAWVAREFVESVLDLERKRLSRAQGEFNRALARYFQILIEDPSLVARADLSFSPSVEIDGEPTPAEALSGGERTALALAFRLAMGRVVRSAGRLKLETLVLDEPTDGFSPEQVARMSELLGELELAQILLVSHEGGLAGIADHVIEVVKEGGKSALRPGGLPMPEEEGEAPEPTAPAAVRRQRRPSAAPDGLTGAAAGIPPGPTEGPRRSEDSRSGAPAASDRPAS